MWLVKKLMWNLGDFNWIGKKLKKMTKIMIFWILKMKCFVLRKYERILFLDSLFDNGLF